MPAIRWDSMTSGCSAANRTYFLQSLGSIKTKLVTCLFNFSGVTRAQYCFITPCSSSLFTRSVKEGEVGPAFLPSSIMVALAAAAGSIFGRRIGRFIKKMKGSMRLGCRDSAGKSHREHLRANANCRAGFILKTL